MGMVSLARDLGLELASVVRTDSSAAIGISHRRGLDNVRHLEGKELWLQEKVINKSVV